MTVLIFDVVSVVRLQESHEPSRGHHGISAKKKLKSNWCGVPIEVSQYCVTFLAYVTKYLLGIGGIEGNLDRFCRAARQF